jgi:hypothetical protein
MARENEADRRPKAYPSGTVGTITPSDTTVISPICCVLIVSVVTTAGSIVVRMLDGNLATIAVPLGTTTLELQYDQVRATGLTAVGATFTGLYNLS